MVLAVSDSRGIGQIHTTRLNGEALSVEPGTGLMNELQGDPYAACGGEFE